MRALTWNLLLALVWVGLTGTFTWVNFIFGLVLGYLVLGFGLRDTWEFRGYLAKVPKVVGFILFFLWDLSKSNMRVAYDVLTPRPRMRPGIIGVTLEAKTDVAITILANLITVTPGTLSLDVSSDRRMLYIHCMYLDDVEDMRAQIKDLERRVIEIFEH